MNKMINEILEEPSVLRLIEEKNDSVLDVISDEVIRMGITNVIFSGRGTSDHAGIYGQYLFQIFCDMSAGLATASAITVYGAQNCLKKSLVIAISQSGYAADSIEILKAAKKCGSVTVAVTNSSDSPLAVCADHCLLCSAGRELSVAATKTFTAQLAVVYLLAMRISGRTDPDKLLTLADCVEKTILDYGGAIKNFAEKFIGIKEGFILSRGITYPIALEAALKIQETCYVKMKGYASSDFYHGPLAQVEKDTVIFVFAAKGKAEAENVSAVEKLLSIGNEPYIITDDENLKKDYKKVFIIPDCGDEFLSPLVFAAFAQLFACHLCIAGGGDPDSPRNLKKVTVTK